MGSGWTVLQALDGSSDPKAILEGDGVPEPGVLIDQLAAALAAIHSIELEGGAIPGLPEVDDPLAGLREWHERLGEPHPAFELAFAALAVEPPPRLRRTVVHGDFRMGNLMVGRAGLTGVLDWELAHAGDPVEDLGWLCVPAWRFTRPRPAGGRSGHARGAARRHTSATAASASIPRRCAWWELAGTLRWGVICVMQAFSHSRGARRSVEHAVIGRRACEVEWDLLELLGVPLAGERGPEPPATAGGRPPRSPAARPSHGARAPAGLPRGARRRRPAAAAGTRGLPAAGRAARARDRGRELEHSAEHAALHAAALASVGCRDERELALRDPRATRSTSATRGCWRRSATPCARSSRWPTPPI